MSTPVAPHRSPAAPSFHLPSKHAPLSFVRPLESPISRFVPESLSYLYHLFLVAVSPLPRPLQTLATIIMALILLQPDGILTYFTASCKALYMAATLSSVYQNSPSFLSRCKSYISFPSLALILIALVLTGALPPLLKHLSGTAPLYETCPKVCRSRSSPKKLPTKKKHQRHNPWFFLTGLLAYVILVCVYFPRSVHFNGTALELLVFPRESTVKGKKKRKKKSSAGGERGRTWTGESESSHDAEAARDSVQRNTLHARDDLAASVPSAQRTTIVPSVSTTMAPSATGRNVGVPSRTLETTENSPPSSPPPPLVSDVSHCSSSSGELSIPDDSLDRSHLPIGEVVVKSKAQKKMERARDREMAERKVLLESRRRIPPAHRQQTPYFRTKQHHPQPGHHHNPNMYNSRSRQLQQYRTINKQPKQVPHNRTPSTRQYTALHRPQPIGPSRPKPPAKTMWSNPSSGLFVKPQPTSPQTDRNMEERIEDMVLGVLDG